MALFADARGDTEWTVEFFNSSGNAPAPEWINWLEKTKNLMEGIVTQVSAQTAGQSVTSPTVRIVRASTMRHQQSRSECGLYSLFYIWARLHKVPTSYFMKNLIPDSLMFEFRQHLFEDPSRKTMRRFNWEEYKNTVKIKWE
jgi:hypothetical protein